MLRRATLTALALAAATSWGASATVPDLLGLVPTDARAVVAVDVAALKAEPSAQQWLLDHQAAWSRVDDDATRFLSEAGLDPMRDVDLMLFAVAGSGTEQRPLALFAGRYDPATLGAALQARGAQLVALGSLTAYRLGDADEEDQPALIRITPDLVLVGTAQTLTQAYEPHTGSPQVVAAETADRHLDLAAPFWMAVAVPERAAEPPSEAAAAAEASPEERAMLAVAAASASIRRVAAWARLDESLRVHAFATADTADNASLFRDAVKGALAAMRLAAQDREPDLVDVLRGVAVDTAGNSVEVAAELPIDLLQRLARDTHRHHHHEAEVTPERQ